MAVIYLDTSAIVKRYRTEKGTDVVEELYERLVGFERNEVFRAGRSCLLGPRHIRPTRPT